MAIVKTNLPQGSALNSNHKRYDYIDSFQGTLIDKNNLLTPTEVCKTFFISVRGLMPKGKHRAAPDLDNFRYEPGEQLAFFKVWDRTANEIILGKDAKFFNFRISLLSEHSTKLNISYSTAVHYNNFRGRLLFTLLKPFHKLLMKTLLRNSICYLESKLSYDP